MCTMLFPARMLETLRHTSCSKQSSVARYVRNTASNFHVFSKHSDPIAISIVLDFIYCSFIQCIAGSVVADFVAGGSSPLGAILNFSMYGMLLRRLQSLPRCNQVPVYGRPGLRCLYPFFLTRSGCSPRYLNYPRQDSASTRQQ